MEKTNFIQKLRDAFESNGLGNTINNETTEQLFAFSRELIEANERFNLTAIKDDDGIILKHFADCATVLKHIPENARLVDVGCGAGFPSIPIAILRKDVTVTSLDRFCRRENGRV